MKPIISKFLFLAALVILTAAYSSNNNMPSEPFANISSNSSNDLSLNLTATGEETVVTMWAGQTINVGTVSVSNDNNFLIITYQTTGSWIIKETQVNISTTPFDEKGSPGLYDYNGYLYTSSEQTVTYKIPVTWNAGETVFILTHATVELKNSDGSILQSETAFGGTVTKPERGAWFATFTYVIAESHKNCYKISGFTFFDINSNGMQDPGEPAIPNVTVLLDNTSTTSDANGYYEFNNICTVNHSVSGSDITGFNHTTPPTLNLEVTSDMQVSFGYNLNFSWIGSQTANGFTIGYWKTNLDKAMNGGKGFQVAKSTLEAYVTNLSNFQILPLNVKSLKDASLILGYNGSIPSQLLSKQLMGSEFN